MRQYISEKVRDGEVLERQLHCPFNPDCRQPLSAGVLQAATTPTLFSRLLQLRSVRWQPGPETGLLVIHCGTPRCPPFLAEAPATRQPLSCPTCARRYCSGCQGDWHEEAPCPQTGREAWVHAFAKKRGWIACPNCGVIVEKLGGCNFITCTSARCNGLVSFCYLCGKEVDAKAHNSHEHFLDGPRARCVFARCEAGFSLPP